ncbi:alginate lyase family protein [Methylocaldum sp.]|uniref:alginate lyase family protein n=1 Tax=Methylocaldum sp. TaxID=1969727 RepID=UPI00321FE9AB
MESIIWYVKRLGVMSGGEIVHRLNELWTLRRLRREHRLGGRHADRRPDGFTFCRGSVRQMPDLPFAFLPTAAETESWLAGEWPALGCRWAWAPDPGIWHVAPDTGHVWPQTFFGSIAYRQGNPYGDARVVWEPSRLQQLVNLALLANADEDRAREAVELMEAVLDSWVKANPPLTGIHYVSAMECALRVIAACHALDLTRDRLTAPEQTWGNLLRLVSSHAPLIAKRLSLHSSAGNHTVAEAAGLVYAGTLFPELPDAFRWRTRGLRILQHEAERQVLPDGGGIEQAFWYQLFIVDLLGLVEALLEHRRHRVPRALADAVRRGRRFLRALADGPDDLPRIGDCDDGYALSRHLRISWSGPAPAENPAIFPNTGYTVVRGRGERPVRLIFDHGPLGMPPAHGHAHADALSLHVTFGGSELLIDPNTYTYTGDPTWRRWFRSTAAHNTVRVDGRDQARQETSFQWSNGHDASLVKCHRDESGRILLLARHDGYRRLGITHWRAIAFDGSDHLLIRDYLAGQGHHVAELIWHLGVEAAPAGAGFVLSGNDIGARLDLAGGVMTLHRGETDPILGWQSPCYGVRKPAVSILVRYAGEFPHQFHTALSFDDAHRDGMAALELLLERAMEPLKTM